MNVRRAKTELTVNLLSSCVTNSQGGEGHRGEEQGHRQRGLLAIGYTYTLSSCARYDDI